MNPFTAPPPSAYEPYGPNGVRQMGGDHAGAHEDSFCARAGLFYLFVDKMVEGGSVWTYFQFLINV